MSKDLVVKHNDLIEASYRFSLIQNRLIVKIATEIRQEDEDFKIHTFQARDLLRELGLGEGNYDDLRRAVRGLVVAPLTIKKPTSTMYATPFSVAEYDDDNSHIKLSIDPQMKPYYLQLKNKFTAYEAQYYYVLSSSYAQRFYELLKQYESIGERKMELTEIREMFMLGNKYKTYNNLKRRVIEPAMKQINAGTDIRISCTEYKYGKRVHALIFKIKSRKTPKKDPLQSKPLFDIPDDDLLSVLKKEAKGQRSDAPGLLEDLDILVTQDKVIISAEDPIHIDRLGTLKDFIEEFFARAGKTVDYK